MPDEQVYKVFVLNWDFSLGSTCILISLTKIKNTKLEVFCYFLRGRLARDYTVLLGIYGRGMFKRWWGIWVHNFQEVWKLKMYEKELLVRDENMGVGNIPETEQKLRERQSQEDSPCSNNSMMVWNTRVFKNMKMWVVL